MAAQKPMTSHIAAAIAASATVETDSIAIDPEKLLQLAPGESYALADETAPSLEFSINPERIGPVLHRLASPTRTRARLFALDGELKVNRTDYGMTWNFIGIAATDNTIAVHAVFTRG